MKSYLDMLRHIMTNGNDRDDRTGTGTRGVFGYQFRHCLADGFPLLTTKRIHIKSIIHELLWFLRGSTNVKELQDVGVSIWDEWADPATGELGPVYGYQWRKWADAGSAYYVLEQDVVDVDRIDQIAALVKGLKENPFGRRHIVTAWNPSDVPKMKLPPCHMLFQCYVEESNIGCGSDVLLGHKLSLQMYQRSADTFLGVPFNIASYAFLTHMLAKVCGYSVGDLVISFGDLHIYKNHFEQVRTQLERTPGGLPSLQFRRNVTSIDGFKFDDFLIDDYFAQESIKAPIAV